ncbi:MAG: hypothetical protein U0X91_24220 [Spirosomataceae bacterium]
MNAISDFIEVKEHKIIYSLPPGFEAERVQIIILPVDEENRNPSKKNRIRSLRKSISGKEAERLEVHVKEIREE